MVDARQCVPHPSWKRASCHNVDCYKYKAYLASILNYVHIPYDAIHCNNLHCTSHGNDINTYCECLIDDCIKATKCCIPLTRKREHAGWNEHVKVSRDDTMF